jgi:geranylgeranyl diphosphate synthase type 3
MYQIQDDYLNLQSDAYTSNKGYCEDLTEGKYSFPIIHSIRADVSNKEIQNILKQKTTDIAIKQYAVSYMRDVTHSFQHCKDEIAKYEIQARLLIGELSKDHEASKLDAILSKLLAVK